MAWLAVGPAIGSDDLARVLTAAGRPEEAQPLAAQVPPTAVRVFGDATHPA